MRVNKFDQINVIPFIDIMLVLLVIVLTTATFVAKGVIPVDLPSAQSLEKEIEKKDTIITIKKDGSMLIGKKEVSKEQLVPYLQTLSKEDAVIINSDKQTPFEHFVYLLDKLKLNGFNNVGVLSKDE